MSDVDKALNRRQFIKKTSLSLAVAGGVLVVGNIIVSPPNLGIADPYPHLPDTPPDIPSFNKSARFFNEQQYKLVATLAAIIIPTDDDPGATEANVVDYIDDMLAESENKQSIYIKGLKWINNLSQKEYGQGTNFVDLKIKQQIDLLRLIDETDQMRNRKPTSFMQRIDRKIDRTWDDLVGLGSGSKFFKILRRDVCYGYFSNPIAWQWIGYYGPPQPNGYPRFSESPSSTNYSDSMRPVRNSTCLACHSSGGHPKDKMVEHTCTVCHSPHSPWPKSSDAFYLEEHAKVLFPSPDRKRK